MSWVFENKWKTKLEEERKKVLFFDRPFLPKPLPQRELTEESVVLYIKQINPQLRRANNRFLRFVDWVLFDLVFGGLVVLGALGATAGFYALIYFLFGLSVWAPAFFYFLCVVTKGFILGFVVLPVPLLFGLVLVWFVRLWDKTNPHPFDALLGLFR